MSKELEALENLKQQAIAFEHSELAIKVANGNYNTLKQALQRLEAIDNAKPNEVLKHFNHFEKWYRKICYRVVTSFELDYDLETIKQYILKAQEQEKVLNIIWEKNVDIEHLKWCINNPKKLTTPLLNYNIDKDKDEELTKEEFDLLKEVFK